MSAPVRVLVNGAKGRMGTEAVRAVSGAKDMVLAAATDLGDDLGEAVRASRARVVVDFTRPEDAFRNFEAALRAGARPVSGTTGFTPEEVRRAEALVKSKRSGGAVVPNFAVGAALAVRFAREAAARFPSVEVIERHHEGKADAPSGTALLAAREIAGARGAKSRGRADSKPVGSRGAEVDGVRVHALRLAGSVAHLEVLFGGPGETLVVRHDATDRACFMPGVLLAVRTVARERRFFHGLEAILDAAPGR
ncbi:MAG TPA: 4-hydroxy-tetrahydrodipicolinate reductase [Planctomycetota bacterium]|nr:4-hydroxy-tetrahydrodipicolinate reductase [Planctomycetota bacterium]